MDESARSAIVIGPMGVGQVIDAGLKLGRQNYRLLTVTIAYAVVPAFVIGVILDLILGGPRLSGLITGIGQILATIAVTIASAELVAPGSSVGRLEPGTLYRLARKRIWKYLLMTIIIGFLAIPLIIIFPLGIYCLIRWSVSMSSLVIDGTGPIHSLRRSWGLTKGVWWHTFGTLFVIGILYLIVAGLVEGIFLAFGGLATVAGSTILTGFFISLGTTLSAVFITPFAATASVVLYYELRARHEGFDLESRAAQLWQTP